MPYCPKCGAEYREGFRECSDCLLELVATPPENPQPPGFDDEPDAKERGKKPSAINNTASCTSCRPKVNLVIVFKAQNDMEAIEVKSMLAGSNISAVIAEAAGGVAMEVPVFVDENDAAEARKLIRASFGKVVEDGEEETVIYELEEGEELLVDEDDEEDEEEEEDDNVMPEQYASTVEQKAEELRRKVEGTDSNKGLLIVLMVVIAAIVVIAYLYYG